MQNQHRAASIAWEAKCCQKQIWLRLRPSAKLSNVKLYHWKKQDFNYETPTVDQQEKNNVHRIVSFTFHHSLPSTLFGQAPELVVILLEGRTDQSTLPCYHGAFLRGRLACANAPDQFPELDRHGAAFSPPPGARLLFCPRKKPPKSEELQGGACGFYWNTSVISCHVMSLFLGFVVVHLEMEGRIFVNGMGWNLWQWSH